MLVHICDSDGCYNIIGEKYRNLITINGTDYELCEDCFAKLCNSVKLGKQKTKPNRSLKKSKETPININVCCGPKVEKAVEAYGGLEKVRDEYLNQRRPARNIAKDIGISTNSLFRYFSKYNVRLYTIENKSNENIDNTKKLKEDD